MDDKSAVIIGASIAGLLTAKILSPYYSKITLLDRDSLFNDENNPRKGIAQAAHAHIFLKRGLTGLDSLLPGFNETLTNAGAVKTNATQDWQSFFPEGFLYRFKSDLDILCQSRHLLETTLRSFVLETTDNLNIIDNADITDTKLSLNKSPTVSYTVNGINHHLTCHLLVDCSGRNSKTPIHLESAGFGAVPKSSISPYLGYATRIFKNVSIPDKYCATLIMAKDPDYTRGGIVLPIENNQHMVTLFGFSKDYPPGDEESYLSFAESLRMPTVFNAIKNADPVTEIKQFVKKDCVFNQYSKLKTWPKGFLVLGDAITSFNPIYGQGITTAIMAVESVSKTFKQRPDAVDFTKLQRKLCRGSVLPWLIAKNEDLRWPGTEGDKASWLLKIMHTFSNKVAKASTYDKYVNYAYCSVLHMTKLPIVLLKPTILYKIFKFGSLEKSENIPTSENKEKVNPL